MRRALAVLALAPLAFLAAAPAEARTDVSPYLEVAQVFTADLGDGGEVLTYSTGVAGIDANVTTRRAAVQISYAYEYRIDWQDELGDQSVHTGLARAAVKLAPGLSVEAGAIATRARSDIRGEAPGLLTGDARNIAQVYSAYAGPSFARSVGPLDVTASYRFGYTKVEAPSDVTLPGGQPVLDRYDDASAHLATASVGRRAGDRPFGWQISGAYEREDADQLDQRFEGAFVRADVTVPVSPTLAVVAGAGYEDIEISQRDALRDAGGAPVLDRSGRFVTDPASPRRLAYETDGFIYDAGVMWRPSRRTQLEARVGKRYGGTTWFGSFTHQLSPASGVSVVVYDGVESFGRLLADNVARLPTNFSVQRNPLANRLDGCIAAPGGSPTGGCLAGVFQSINTVNFRNRGITALWTAERGPLSLAAGIGYARRRYYAPDFGTGFTVDGVVDESWFAQGSIGYALDDRSGLEGSLGLGYYDSGIALAPDVTSASLSGTYYYNFSRNLSAAASLGLFAFDQDGVEDLLTASALVALRYRF